MAAENNIIIKITSEADLDSAQKQLQELTNRAKEQEKALRELSDVEKEDAKSVKELGLVGDKLAKALKKNKDYYQELRDQKKADITETKKSIQELNNQVKAYKTLNGQSGRMVQQLRAMREQLQRMEEAGEFGTKAFIDLSIAAGQLEDQIGDTQQRIRVLASDTKEIDALLGLGDGLAGSFYVATSAAELFGGDMEGLQNAFYKVQAAMSVVSGVQQVWNALNKDSAAMVVLNTALSKLFSKQKQKSAAATSADAAASGADTAAKGAQAAATTTATVAQKGLNAAMKANPIGVIIALILVAVAAVAALGIGIAKLVHYFSDAGKAQRDYAAAAEEFDKAQAKNAAGAAKRSYERQKQIQALDNAEQEALDNAIERNASELEMAQIKSNFAKLRAQEAEKYNNDEIARNNLEIEQMQKMVEAKQREVNAYKDGSDKKKKAQEELNEVEQKYYDALQKTNDLEQENADAQKAAADAAKSLADTREQLLQQTQQANIDLMKEGAAKEIAQIKLNYKEQFKTLQGNSAEEVALRKALIAKQSKEIAAVRKKYAQQEQKTAIQEQKNLLAAMSQSSGTEADYAEEIALTKEIAEAEAQARIDALDKEQMTEKEYAAEVESIRIDLANTLRDIDEKEVERTNENAKRRTEIEVQAAEARKNALTGAEGIDEQKAIVQDYYDTLKKQIVENAEMERQAVERSTDTAEVKAEKIKQIDAQMRADIAANAESANQELIDIDTQHIAQLERNASDAADAVSKAMAGDKIEALKSSLDAQLALHKANLDRIEALYADGLITYQDYEQQKWELTKEIGNAEAEFQSEKMQTISENFSTAIDTMQQAADIVFGAISDNIQQQMDDLDNLYTTDAEEAKKDADKKYISEKELTEKKLALKRKQAAVEKTQAAFNIALNTAMAIMRIWADVPKVDFGATTVAMTAVAAAIGAAQLALVLSKPLPAYAKGRIAASSAGGEYALVGERGAEIMWIPKGAGIIPNNKIDKPDMWGEYNVPRLSLPEQPQLDKDMMAQLQVVSMMAIDYNRLGKAVADNVKIPQQTSFNVTIDRNGVTTADGRNTHTFLNKKYFATWK